MRTKPKKKLSKRLALRTKLTPAQLERVQAEGNGAASKYDGNGQQSLALTRRLAAAKRKAKRLVLYTDQLGRRMYIADRAKIPTLGDASPLTFDKGEALHFIEGFDRIDSAKYHWEHQIKAASYEASKSVCYLDAPILAINIRLTSTHY